MVGGRKRFWETPLLKSGLSCIKEEDHKKFHLSRGGKIKKKKEEVTYHHQIFQGS